MEINGLGSMAMALNKAEVGQDILNKTLRKTAEVEQQQQQQETRRMQMQVSTSSTAVAAMTGKGSKIDIFA